MNTVGEIYRFIDEIAPFHTAMDFDNVGLLVGDEKQLIGPWWRWILLPR